MNDVRTELKLNGPISLDNADVRKLAEKSSVTIKISDLKGKSNGHIINFDLYACWNGLIIVLINGE